MIYIYRPQPSAGAISLAERLTELGHPAKKVQEINPLRRRRIAEGAKLVSWGGYIPGLNGLNNVPLTDKLQDAIRLMEAGVSTIEIARERPTTQVVGRGTITLQDDGLTTRSPDGGFQTTFDEAAARHTIQELQAWLSRPLPVGGPDLNWLGRLRHHVGGNDLLNPPARPDFWVKKEDIRIELRIHIFEGVSIRAGTKQPRAGVAQPHPWIRSWDGGWMISYHGEGVRQAHRDLARAAITALGLSFGAVDIGIRQDGTALVLEVNRAPGLEGNTIIAYANAIVRGANG